MKPYSQDLRDRVIAAITDKRQSQKGIAETLGVGLATVKRWCKQWRETGSVAMRPFRRGRRRTLRACDEWLRAEVKRQPDLSLAELCERVQAVWGLTVSQSMMCRELQLLNLPVKKNRSTIVHVRRLA